MESTAIDAPKQDSKSITLKRINEFGVDLNVNKDSLSPKKNEGFYSPEMCINRALVTTALSCYCSSGDSVFSPVKCIDAIGSTGVAGLLWKKYLSDLVDVHINDSHERSHELISSNIKENNLSIKLLNRDPRILLQEMPFNFIYLDCHTDAALYLDSMMRNITKQGIFAVTTKDDGALYGKTPEIALRNYGGMITRTFYSKELAARLIIAGMVRSAAVHNKGVEVLCVFSLKSTISIIAKVLKGPASANASVERIRRLIHCNMCEDCAFYPCSIYPVEKPEKLLSCNCSEQTPGKVVIDLGPVWSGCLYNFDFLVNMYHHLDKFPWKKDAKDLLETLLFEAWCPNLDEGKVLQLALTKEMEQNGSEKDLPDESISDVLNPPNKKLKKHCTEKKSITCPYKSEPCFYFNLHKHSPKGPKMVRATKVVTSLHKFGYRASRTHFDPLAVRTDATLRELKKVISVTVD